MQHKSPVLVVILLIFLGAFAPIQAQTQEGILFPDLTGDYQVGRTEYHLIDETRPEIFTEDSDDVREFMIRVYYPADPAADALPAPYLDEAQKMPMALAMGVLPTFFDQLHSHAYADAPAVDGSYPVVIFSPGFGNPPQFYSATLEDLASHGYIVVSLSHTYSTVVTLFPEDRTVKANEAGSAIGESDANTEKILNVWLGDVLYTLDWLRRTEMSAVASLLAGHLDLTRIGAFGHSFGGATVAEVAYQDSRVLAAINMDGTMFGAVSREGLAKPFMMMRSEMIPPTDEELAQGGMTREQFQQISDAYEAGQNIALQSATPGYRFQLAGSAHNSYSTDYMLVAGQYPDLLPASMVGTIPGNRAVEIINTYVVSFFDKHVKGVDVPLLDAVSEDYPEVTFEVFNS